MIAFYDGKSEYLVGIAATVILYQPDNDVVDNIVTYVDKVDILYIIDNSEKVNTDIRDRLQKKKNVKYISFSDNKGIAKALNHAIHLANIDGHKYLMTMDQDSKFTDEELAKYIEEAINLFKEDKSIILCGINHLAYFPKSPQQRYERVDEVITSGMILDIEKVEKIGGFLEKLFIDYVDYELCYRAYKNGFTCMMINDCYLTHQVGSVNPIDRYGIHFNNHNEHNKYRMYYLFRNMIYILKKYPFNWKKSVKDQTKNLLKIVLVEENKKEKIVNVLLGIKDGIIGRYGHYPY